jgi:hypothetical protein
VLREADRNDESGTRGLRGGVLEGKPCGGAGVELATLGRPEALLKSSFDEMSFMSFVGNSHTWFLTASLILLATGTTASIAVRVLYVRWHVCVN